MKKSISNKYLYFSLGIIFIILLWSICSLTFDSSSMIFPSIFKVLTKTIELLKSSYLYKCLFYTFERMAIGFVVAFILAIILGTIAGNNEKFYYFISPLLVVLKTVPTACLVYFFLILSGSKNAPIYIVILICFPIIYESIISGYNNIDPNIEMSLMLEPTNNLTKIVKVKMPLIVPSIISGVAASLGLSFKIEIMAEILTGSTTNGLGSAISYIQKSDPTNMTSIFAYSLIAISLALIISLVCEKITKSN